MINFICITIVLGVLLVPGVATAGDDAIQSLKEKAAADFKASADALTMKYLIALEKLQKSLASAGDLDGAVAVKNEAIRVKAVKVSLLPDRKPSASPTRRVDLMALDARLAYGTVYDPTRAVITGWSRTRAGAQWSLTGLKSGTYKVTLSYFAGNLGGGMFVMRTAANRQEFSVAGEGKWDELRRQEIGEFYLRAGDLLKISVLAGSGREMIYVDTVELEPVRK